MKILFFLILIVVFVTGCSSGSDDFVIINTNGNVTVINNNFTNNITINNNVTNNITINNNFTTINNITNNITNNFDNNYYTNITNNITVNNNFKTINNFTYNITNNITINASVDSLTIKNNNGVITGNYTNGTQGINIVGNLISIVQSYFTNLFYTKSEIDTTTSNLQTNISNVNSTKADKTQTIRSVNSPIFINGANSGTFANDINLSIPQANDTTGGFLTATDHAWFGSKLNDTDQRYNNTALISSTGGLLQTNITNAINSALSDNTTQASLINTKASLNNNNLFYGNNTFNADSYFLGTINLFNSTANAFNLSFLLKDNTGVIKGNWSINSITGNADLYTSGTFYENGFSLNSKYNDTLLIGNINTSLLLRINSDNSTQALLITHLFNANTTTNNAWINSNSTQALLISNLDNRESSNNITQANLINILFNANTTLWNRQSSDNTTLTNFITALGSANSTILAREQANNVTQNNLIITKLNLSGGTLTGNLTLQNNQSNIILSGGVPRYIWYMNATFWDCLNATGTIYNRGNASIACA